MRRTEFYPQSNFFRFFCITLLLVTCLFSASSLLNAASAAEVTLAWDANSEANLDGYKLYYKFDTSGAPYNGTGLNEGDSPVIIYLEDLDDTSLPQYTLSGLGEGQLYYFALTAFDTDGLESDYSDEVSYEVPLTSDLYTITASVEGQGGSISPEGTVSVAEGGNQTFSIVADSYYSISDVIVDGISVGPVSAYSFENIIDDHTIEAVFELDTFTVIAAAGVGGTISPEGATTAAYGESLSYTITPDENHHITDVLVDGESVGAVATYTFEVLDASHTIEAVFGQEIVAYTLTASSGDGGTISPGGITTVYSGSELSYAIIPDANYHIADVKVDGASVGAVTTYTFDNITASHTIEAVFELDSFTITAISGSGLGMAFGNILPAGVTTVFYGESVSYTITPASNYHIADVLVDGESVGSVSTYTFDNISASHIIAAVFELDTLSITAVSGDGGTISPAGVTTVDFGTSVSYTITPAENYHIADVTVDGASVGIVPTYTFEDISASHTIEAEFAIDTFTVTATAGDGGSISPAGITNVGSGSGLSYTITPDINYHIVDVVVDDVSVGPVAAYTFNNISASHTIAAVFEVDTLSITAVSGDGGTISPAGVTTVDVGTSVSYIITPDANYQILDVVIDGESVGALESYTFENITASHIIEGVFEPDSYTVTAVAGDGGTISPEGTTTATYGMDLSYTITPEDNYHIVKVLIDGSSVGQVTTYTFENITTPHTIEAVFEIDTFTVTADSSENGTITPYGIESAAYGSSLSYIITPDANYHVADVVVDGASVGAVTAFTFDNISASHTITAVFEINTLAITAVSGDGGTISPAGVTTADFGSSVSYTITPDANYHILDVTVDGSSVGPTTVYTFDNITAAHTIEAVFEIDTFTITATAGANGMISPEGIANAAYGSNMSYTITPAESYHISDVMVDGASVGPVAAYTFENITVSHTIEAVFELDTFSIAASAAENGTVSPEGAIEVALGASQVFTVVPDTGYVIEDVMVDGESIGAVTEYTFSNITADHTLEAVFVEAIPGFAMEVGSVVVADGWQQVSLERTFVDPVVVAARRNEETVGSLVIRINNVTGTGFEIEVTTDGAGKAETIEYVVMEAGNFTLPDGTVMEADTFVTEDITGMGSQAFADGFIEAPATGASVITCDNSWPVIAKVQNISTVEFEYQLEGQGDTASGLLSEMVSYIALDRSQIIETEAMAEAGITEEMMNLASEIITFNQLSASEAGTDDTEENTGSEEDTATSGGSLGDMEENATGAEDSAETTEDSGSSSDGVISTTGDDASTTDDMDSITGEADTILGTDSGAIGVVANNAPENPVPVSYSSDVAPATSTIELILEAFSDPDAGDYHTKTEWEVFDVESGLCVLSVVSATALTEFSVPDIMLEESTEYYWHARYFDSNGAASEWSEPAVFYAGVSDIDMDGNGVPDEQQVDGSVDLNLDGIADADQEVIKSLVMPSSGQPIGLSVEETDSAAEILFLEAVDAEALPVSDKIRPSIRRLPHGLINFKLAVAEPGDMAYVTVYFSEPAHRRARWMKLDLINNEWIDYSGYAQFSKDRMSVEIELVDGGYGDDDGVANGIIVDPAGLQLEVLDEASTADSTDNVQAASDVSAGAGCFISGATGDTSQGWPMAIVLFLVFGSAVMRLGFRKVK